MANAKAGSIRPLPAEAVAQIKSSSTIVSLADVVLELLKNALDAGATTVEVSVDFSRGACSVEDDGLGIAPVEFRESGGLGKLYWTSKYFSEHDCLGRHGTFLASLAAVSLLTITSRHHLHRSHNSITFHMSKTIERQLPAPARHQVKYEHHGSRVTVRNLFGNLPVRVKQRTVVGEQKGEHRRLWDALKRDTTALMLSWQRPVSVKVRDADHRTVFSFSGQTPSTDTSSYSHISGKPRSERLQFLLTTLTQADYISVSDWSSWVPACASTSQMSIKGAISLEPAPTRRAQFISLGSRPLSAHSGHNELYDEVNRLFSLSSFGTVEDDVDVDEGEKIRREHDKRFKSDGYTNRQLKGRKGVDRFPMFHLRICLEDKQQSSPLSDEFLHQETNLRAVVEVLRAMVTQWLSAHHLRPQKPRFRGNRPNTASTSTSENDRLQQSSTPVDTPPPSRDGAKEEPLRARSANPDRRKRKLSELETSRTRDKRMNPSPFIDWTRIKSGKPEFYDNVWGPEKGTNQAINRNVTTSTISIESTQSTPPPHGFATFNMEPILAGSLNGSATPMDLPQKTTTDSGFELDSDEGNQDGTVTWMNPITKETFRLNARTGCVIPKLLRPHSEPSVGTVPGPLQGSSKTLRLQKRPNTADDTKNLWLNGLLRNWNNPVFKPTEKSIQLVSHEENNIISACGRSGHSHCSRVDLDNAMKEMSMSSTSRLSKEGLRSAQIIAQLDKKFILVKIFESSGQPPGRDGWPEALVIVDQHAADERIRVESLLTELCTPLPETHGQYRSKLGYRSKVAFSRLEKPLQFSISAHEGELFVIHAAVFATWGILYNITNSRPLSGRASGAEKEPTVLSVATLPPSVSERCKADPKLLISFLRTTVWKCAEDPHSVSNDEHTLSTPTATTTEELDKSPVWLKRLSSCPPGLVDLINSRACRSAIMFNDELDIQQCEDLVSRLARCVFPFMCAHGRPSMVPLVNLDKGLGLGSGLRLGRTEDSASGKGFVDAWKIWKQK